MFHELLNAMNKGDMTEVTRLLEQGAPVNKPLQNGYSLLMLGSGMGNAELVGLLLDHAADPNLVNNGGTTALELAVLKDAAPVVDLLLARGADPNHPDNKGYTPLMYAALKGNAAVAELLLKAGASPTAVSPGGKKAADFAAEKGFSELAQQLAGAGLEKGADQNLVPPKKPVEEIRVQDLVGQTAAKAALEQVIAVARINQERQKRSLPAVRVNFHAVFSGSPGTGKTTFARFYAQEIKKLGILKTGQLIEVTRNELVAEYAGQTAGKTTAVVKKALGGVLFIDEAYSLKNSKDDVFGQECIDTLIKLIEDNRDQLVLILAGYTDEMRQFLHQNPGLKSRIPNEIVFADFTDEELSQIFDQLCKKQGFKLAESNRAFALEQIALQKKGRSFGNAREVRNLFERALSQQSLRLAKADLDRLSQDDLCTLVYSDLTPETTDDLTLPPAAEKRDRPAVLDELMGLVGLEPIKAEIRELLDFIAITRQRSHANVFSGDLNLHMIFKGNPGTGKTTVARLMGRLFREMGLLSGGHLVETDRSGLVGGYLGQTALKTKERVQDALGGVLFVDEAYTLFRGDGVQDTYGQEAIDTLLKLMEDHVGQFMVILSGYPDGIEALLESNPGLASRFGKTLLFADYTDDELLVMAKQMAREKQLELAPEACEALKKALVLKKQAGPNFGNGREVRNLLEQAVKKQATRLVATQKERALGADELNVLVAQDWG